MKTNQIMKRELPITGLTGEVYNKTTIRQRTKDGYFNATDLLKIYNKATGSKKKMNNFLRKQETEDFSNVIENNEYAKERNNDLLVQNIKDANKRVLFQRGEGEDQHLLTETKTGQVGIKKKAYEKARGRNGGTWLHPYLFLDFAMWLSPEFKYQAIKWIYDNLVKFRVQSGDHFKDMCKAIAKNYYDRFDKKPPREIYKAEALEIKKLVGLDEGQDWNNATEKQLKLRDRLQKANTKAHLQGKYKKERIEYLERVKETFELAYYQPQF
ncbi:MAG: KilA-N domain-containing protein [Candidatus Marinimicrobia bacterium]|nr:KilA-N domain-containing protein [Candidatus Neomarinimicrobiota bacterium]